MTANWPAAHPRARPSDQQDSEANLDAALMRQVEAGTLRPVPPRIPQSIDEADPLPAAWSAADLQRIVRLQLAELASLVAEQQLDLQVKKRWSRPARRQATNRSTERGPLCGRCCAARSRNPWPPSGSRIISTGLGVEGQPGAGIRRRNRCCSRPCAKTKGIR